MQWGSMAKMLCRMLLSVLRSILLPQGAVAESGYVLGRLNMLGTTRGAVQVQSAVAKSGLQVAVQSLAAGLQRFQI